MTPEQFREVQEFVADSTDEPSFHIKSSRGVMFTGWQGFADWIVIHRPKRIEVTVTEWEDITGLLEEALEELE